LADEKYNSWIKKLAHISLEPDSPIVLKNNIWSVKNRKKLLLSLQERVSQKTFELFQTSAIKVLTEHNLKLESPVSQSLASTNKQNLTYSHQLRKGFAESLAILGCFSAEFKHCSSYNIERITMSAVFDILKKPDWVLWASLDDLLPFLAEAAPEVFLEAVEQALLQKPCPFDSLFEQGHSWNYPTGLLWALETLAWTKSHIVQVSVILGKLATRYPGENSTNRSLHSLVVIFLPWYPQTTASIEKRKVAVKALMKESPDIAWKLLLDLLPNKHQSSTGSHKPRWRNFIPKGGAVKVTTEEYREQIDFYAELAVSDAKDDINKLSALIINLNNLPKTVFDELLVHLSSEAVTEKPEEQKSILWNGLVELTEKHRRYSDAHWAFDSDLLKKIDEVASKLKPTSPESLYARLFNKDDIELYEKDGDWSTQEKQLEEKRQQALIVICDDSGVDGVIKFSKEVKFPSTVGCSMGGIVDTSMDIKVLPAYLESVEKNLQQFAEGFISSRYRHNGWDWVDNIIKKGWSKSQVSHFYIFLPFTSETWKRVSEQLSDVESMYWKKTNIARCEIDDELNFAIDKLIKYGRPYAATNCIHQNSLVNKPLNIKRIVRVLDACISSKEQPNTSDLYHIVDMIKALQNDGSTSPDDLCRIEWNYLLLLNDGSYQIPPRCLEERLASNPDFFCEKISLAYRAKDVDENQRNLTKSQKTLADKAWHLLNKWRTPPGTQGEGSFNERHFNVWLKKVWETCEKNGRLDVALRNVGKVLFYCPPNGLWINKAAAAALNGEDADEMRRGFRSSIFNSRGAYKVDPTGKPEAELSKKYRQQADEVENAGFTVIKGRPKFVQNVPYF